MVAEVDIVIRNLKVVNVDNIANAGTIRFYAHAEGVAPATANAITAAVALGNDQWDVTEIPLSVANNTVKRGDIISATTASLASGDDVAVIVGWMPDLFSQDASPRSYSLP